MTETDFVVKTKLDIHVYIVLKLKRCHKTNRQLVLSSLSDVLVENRMLISQ